MFQDPTLENLEDELKVLSEGLCAVEEVRDWLFTRITAIQEEKLYIKSVPKYSSQDVSKRSMPQFELMKRNNEIETWSQHALL